MNPDPESVPGREDVFLRLLASFQDQCATGTPSGEGQDPSDQDLQSQLRECQTVVRLLQQWLSTGQSAVPPDPGASQECLTQIQARDSQTEQPIHLGPFEIVRILGQGGFGLVYLAIDHRLQRQVALKVPRLEVMFNLTLRQRFLHEAQIAAQLDHPNLVPVLEVGEVVGVIYIATPFCPGPTLASWLQQQSDLLAPREAAALVQILAAAIAYTHSRSVLHRDLKPSNIILHQPDEERSSSARAESSLPGTPRICDFGLARILDHPSGDTQQCRWIGTPAYMAPEQAAGRMREIGVTTDVYALGAILYELLTGQPPFTGTTDQEIVQRTIQEVPVAPRLLRCAIPTDLEAICLKCLEKSPSRRYPSAQALEEDLHRFLAGEPTQARPLRRTERIVRWVRHNPLLAALTGVLLASFLVILTGMVSYSLQLREAFSQLHAQQQEVRHAQEHLRLHQYADHIRMSAQALQSHNRPLALQLLKACLPTPDQEDLRNFPWGYLWDRCQGERFTLAGHQEDVYQAGFSSAGQMLATTGKDGMICLWNPHNGTKLRQWRAHLTEANDVVFSPDGHTLASSSDDDTIRLWDPASGTLQQTLRGHRDDVHDLCFTRDGKGLVSLAADGEVRFWDLSKGTSSPVLRVSRDILDEALITPDGDAIILATTDRHIACHTIPDNRVLWTMQHTEDRVRQLAWEPHRGTLATTMRNYGVISLWDPLQQKLLSRFHVPELSFTTMTFSPDGALLAVGFRHGGFRIWDTRSKELLGLWQGHDRRLWDLTFNPEGSLLVSSAGEGKAKIWEMRRLRTDLQPLKLDHFLGEMALAHSHPWLVLGTWNREQETECAVELWDHVARKRCAKVRFPDGGMNGIAVALGDQVVYVADARGEIHCYRLPDLEPQRSLGDGQKVYSLALSRDGRWLAAGGNRGVRLWDLSRGEQVAQLEGKSGVIRSVAFSPDSSTLAWSGNEGWIAVGEPGPHRLLREWFSKTTSVRGLTFSPDGSLLAGGGEDGLVRLWNWRTGNVMQVLAGHPQTVYGLTFNPEGEILGSWDRVSSKLWDVRTGEELLVFALEGYHTPLLLFDQGGTCLFQALNDSRQGYIVRYRSTNPSQVH